MSVTSEMSEDGKSLTINVSGRFDFSTHRDFRLAYEKAEGASARYVLDLSSTEYMDSSALGMLLMLRDHAGGDEARVEIANAPEGIRAVLAIANFQKLFSIAD